MEVSILTCLFCNQSVEYGRRLHPFYITSSNHTFLKWHNNYNGACGSLTGGLNMCICQCDNILYMYYLSRSQHRFLRRRK
jgi:hypothetical protein